jgi:hypothetical protein
MRVEEKENDRKKEGKKERKKGKRFSLFETLYWRC